MSHDAVALLRIPGYTPPDDADVRELDDGFLLFLEVPFENDPEAILDAILDVVGEAIQGHDDERGIFVLPDAAEPEEATTYDAVIEATAASGLFLAPDDGEEAEGMPDVQAMLGQVFESLGAGSMEDLARAMQTGDQDALKMAQVRMMGALERAMGPAPIDAPEEPALAAQGDAGKGDAAKK